MPELRWSLLILGLLVVAGVYLYSRLYNGATGGEKGRGVDRAEPRISGEDLWGDELDRETEVTEASSAVPADSPTGRPRTITEPRSASSVRPAPAPSHVAPDATWEYGADEEGPLLGDMDGLEAEPGFAAEGPTPDPDRIVAMRVAATAGNTLSAEEMVLKLRELGLRHGRYGIFHRHGDDTDSQGQPLFSVASMTEPGSFDLTTLRETRLPGVSLFMVLPGPGDPVENFDIMVKAARDLARDLQGEVLDESGSTWSIQRERYVREDLIRYRLHYGTARP